MNRISKVALCVGLAAIGVLAWSNYAVAGKPASFPAVLTFISGDIVSAGDVVSAESQIAGRNRQESISIQGTVNATIAFDKYVEAAASCSIGDPEFFTTMYDMQLSRYVLDATVTKGATPQVTLWFKVTGTDNVAYTIIMHQFTSVEITSVDSTDVIHASGGRVAVYALKQNGQVSTIKAVACNIAETVFSVRK